MNIARTTEIFDYLLSEQGISREKLQELTGLAHEKSIPRFIKRLESEFDTEIKPRQINGKRHYFCKSDPFSERLKLTEDQKWVLYTIISQGRSVLGQAFEQEYQDILSKLGPKLNETLSVADIIRNSHRLISFSKKGEIQTFNCPFFDAETGMASDLFAAIDENYVCKMTYTNRKNEVKEYLIEPLHYFVKNLTPFILACKSGEGKILSFRPQAILSFEQTSQKFIPPSEKEIQVHVDSAFGAFFGTKYQVEIEVNNSILPQLQEKLWMPKQEFIPMGKNITLMKFEASGDLDIINFVLSWGVEMRLVEPPELLKKLKTRIKELDNLYMRKDLK